MTSDRDSAAVRAVSTGGMSACSMQPLVRFCPTSRRSRQTLPPCLRTCTHRVTVTPACTAEMQRSVLYQGTASLTVNVHRSDPVAHCEISVALQFFKVLRYADHLLHKRHRSCKYGCFSSASSEHRHSSKASARPSADSKP